MEQCSLLAWGVSSLEHLTAHPNALSHLSIKLCRKYSSSSNIEQVVMMLSLWQNIQIPCRWTAFAKKMSKMTEDPFYLPCAAPMLAGGLAAVCQPGDRCSHPGTCFPTHRQTPSPSLLQERRAVQSGLPNRHCAPRSNMLKPEERHLFMLSLNLVSQLPEDWRMCSAGFWPGLCRLDL